MGEDDRWATAFMAGVILEKYTALIPMDWH